MKNSFTVATPSFNQGTFIEKTIQSVLGQEGDFSIEYIIADGGSTDETLSIIKKYDELLKNKKIPIKCKSITFTWSSKKDNGQSNALNEAFRKSGGEILAWINSDDAYMPGAFQAAHEAFRNNPACDMVYGDARCIDLVHGREQDMKAFQGGFRELCVDNFIFQSSTFFTRKIFEKAGGLDESLSYALDFDLWVRISKTSMMLYIPKVLSQYVVWIGAKTVAGMRQSFAERMTVNQRYGMKIANPAFAYAMADTSFFRFIKRYFPSFYRFLRLSFGTLTRSRQ